MNKAVDYVQQMSTDTVGKISVTIGGGGTTIQLITDYTSLFILSGNALLVAGGLYLMSTKLLNKRKRKDSG